MDLPSICQTLGATLLGLILSAGAMAGEQTAPVGFYTLELAPGDQSVGISLVNPDLLSATILGVTGNEVKLNGVDLPTLLAPGGAYYLEITASPSGPLDPRVGQRYQVDTAQTLGTQASGGGIRVDLQSPLSTSGSLTGLAGCRLALREHLTLNQVFPKDQLHGNTSFSRADQVQFFDGQAFDICYVYSPSPGLAQWVGLKSFQSRDNRIIPPGAGVIFKRSSKVAGILRLRISGVARTTPFVQPLTGGYNFVSEGFPVTSSFVQREAWPAAYRNTDRVKLYDADGFVTYRLYSNGTAPADNIWATVGDRTYTPVNSQSLFDFRRAAFLQLTAGDPGYRYPPPFTP